MILWRLNLIMWKKFKERNIRVHISDSVINGMIELTRYAEFGARKIDRIIEDKIDDYVIDNILDGKTEITVSSH